MTLEAVLDPDWLGQALDDIDDGDRVMMVEEVDSSKTLAQKVRFRVTVEAADGARRTRAYCVKAHLDGTPGRAPLLGERGPDRRHRPGRGDGSRYGSRHGPHGVLGLPEGDPSTVAPVAEQRFADIRWWNEPAKGGHFAAFEQPALFVDEVRSFFRVLRAS